VDERVRRTRARATASRTGAPRVGVPRPRRTAPARPERRSWGAQSAPRTPRPPRAEAPQPARGPRRRSTAERARIGSVVASVLVLLVTGTAWGLYRDITAGITTTDVIAGGGDGGDQDILLVGVDSRTDAQGNPLPAEVLRTLHAGGSSGVLNSDTIILLHVPEDGGRATAFSIPRDSYVDIPGYGRDKVNAAYPATKAVAAEELVAEGVQDRARIEAESAQAGRSALIGAVEGLTGVEIDHYAEINLLGFYNLTTAIGGVEVCLNAPVDEPLSGAELPAGPQTISGADALAFVRQRHELPQGDLSRIRRQQVFLAAVADKILSSGTLTNPRALRDLIDVAQRSLVIDEGWDLLAFARQAAGIAAGAIEFVTIPTAGRTDNASGDVLLVDPAAVSAFVERHIEVEPPPEPAPDEAPAEAPAPPPVDVDEGRYVVHVGNGSDAAGLAATVSEALGAAGFVRGTVGNTEPSATSVVRHRDSEAAARAVAARLGGLDVERDGSVSGGHVQVVLGADFEPGPQLAPAVRAASATSAAPAPPPDGTITAAGVPCID
jgi:LCP family protein required for cell wall assembly